MNKNPKFLLVTADAKLAQEFADAVKGLPDMHPVTHVAGDYRQGLEAARNRRPDIAFVEMTRNLSGLKALAEEVAACSPETVVAALFSPDAFGADVSESAVLIEAMRAGVRDFLRRPLSSADLHGLLERLTRQHAVQPARLGKVVCFISNKGGVGKSTTSVNLSCQLGRRHPGQVLLIDASLQMGVCATMLNLKPATTLTDAVRERERLDQTLIRQLATPHSSGLELLAAPADALEAAEVDDEIISRVLTLARREYEYLIVDSFPLLDRVMMAVLDLSDRVYLVLDSLVPTVVGAAKLLEVLDRLGFAPERRRIVLNRYAGFAGDLRPADIAARLGRDLDHVLPYEKKLLLAANLGQPHIMVAGRLFAAWAREIRRIASDIDELRPEETGARARPTAAPSENGVVNTERGPS